MADFDGFWDYDRPGVSEQRFQDLLPAARESADLSYVAGLLTQIARAQGLQRRFEEAHATLDTAESLIGEGHTRARIRYLLERGRVFNSSGEREQAREYFEPAWELASRLGEDFYAADAAHMMGIAEEPDKQLDWSLRALALAERSEEPRARGWLGSLYNNIGWTFHDQGQYDEALRYFELGLTWRREQGRPRETRIAAYAVARAYRSLGRIEEALAMQRENLRQAQALGDPDGYIEEEIGECLLALDRANEAAPHFARAYELLSQDEWLADSEPKRLTRLHELATEFTEHSR